MDKPTIDVRRTCKATHCPSDHGTLQPGVFDYAEPGLARKFAGDHLLFCCPGCGRTGAIRATRPKNAGGEQSWEITGGTLDDVTTLTLSPSIHCVGCCGWHGYLTSGEFRSC